MSAEKEATTSSPSKTPPKSYH